MRTPSRSTKPDVSGSRARVIRRRSSVEAGPRRGGVRRVHAPVVDLELTGLDPLLPMLKKPTFSAFFGTLKRPCTG